MQRVCTECKDDREEGEGTVSGGSSEASPQVLFELSCAGYVEPSRDLPKKEGRGSSSGKCTAERDKHLRWGTRTWHIVGALQFPVSFSCILAV